MKHNRRAILLCLLLIAIVVFAAGCGETETPYQINDAENYTVSVKFDANGGTFTTNTPVIVDSYNPTQMKTNGEGKAEIALIPPDSDARGKNGFKEITNNGYFLAGWYKTCTVQTDANGEKTYTYADKWNFETDRLTVDPKGTYSSAEPQLTLYAAWVPLFSVEYYDLKTGELITTVQYNPTLKDGVKVPVMNVETGAYDLHDIPEREGFTFNGLYLDAEGKQPVEAETVAHTGTVDAATATAQNPTMKLYVDWKEGKWFEISTPEQLVKNAALDGCYILTADLDFKDSIWPTLFMYGKFTGKIIGNGHTICNVRLEQTDTSQEFAGIFGALTQTAQISDLTVENAEVVLRSGSRLPHVAFGLLAGSIEEGAQLSNLQLKNSVLKIDSGYYFGTGAHEIGVVYSGGYAAQITTENITCEATGDTPESIVITVAEDGTVTVSPAT